MQGKRAIVAIPDAIETRRLGFRTFVRLSTFAQLKERFHRPGIFRLFPGEELTDMAVSFGEETRKYEHVNVFNIAKDLHTCCGSGWLMVDCMGELTEQNIASSLKNGNFYSSNGVYINDIEFDARTGTLEVNVQAEPGLKYRIDFITTKKIFDRHMELKEFTLDNAIRCRTRPVIPEGIGRIASSVDGTSASYAMESDDLYVRALITSNRPGMLKAPHYPRFESAWTQPYPNCR